MENVIEVNLSDAEITPLLGDYESAALGNIIISRNNNKLHSV
jgi:hypothetical protein